MDFIVVDNFFDNFELIENEFKKIRLYNQEEFNKNFNMSQTWPGKRSQDIQVDQPFLYNLTCKELASKLGYLPMLQGYLKMSAYIHLRLQTDEQLDWIHSDPDNWSLLVYLGETNINSGTKIYNNNEECIATINYVKNRLLMFKSTLLHSSFGNFGNNIENGRLTLNCFIYE